MAHPYAHKHQNKVAHERVGKVCGYADGGPTAAAPAYRDMPFYEQSAGIRGSIKRGGVNTYRRELGRDMETGKVGGKRGIKDLLDYGEKPPLEKRGGRVK